MMIPAMIQFPCPKIELNAFDIFGTPSFTPVEYQTSAGATPIAAESIRNAYPIRITAVYDILLTALGPKYSLTISVIINSSGQSKTPHVRLNERPLSPNKVKLTG